MAGVSLLLLVLLGCAVAPVVRADARAEDALRLNELRVKGTHNSYHRHPLVALHPTHRYDHDALMVQLEFHGVRALELDLHKAGDGRFEVYHIRMLDGRTHCRAFESCLAQIRAWMDARPRHEPLLIWIEAKDFAGGQRIASLREVDPVIRRFLGDRLISPDDVRGAHPSLRSALMSDGWPTLGDSRGRALFMLVADDEQRAEYTSGFRHLDGRVMFVEAKPDEYEQSWAAVAKVWPEPSATLRKARDLRLLLTSTVCTAGMEEALCTSFRRHAMSSGINVLLDDFVRPTRGRSDYLELGHETIGRVPPLVASPEEAADAGLGG